MEKNYIVKSISVKVDSKWKCCGYNINYHHKNYPDSIQSQFYSVEDMKEMYWKSNEAQVMDLKGKELAIEKKLIF